MPTATPRVRQPRPRPPWEGSWRQRPGQRAERWTRTWQRAALEACPVAGGRGALLHGAPRQRRRRLHCGDRRVWEVAPLGARSAPLGSPAAGLGTTGHCRVQQRHERSPGERPVGPLPGPAGVGAEPGRPCRHAHHMQCGCARLQEGRLVVAGAPAPLSVRSGSCRSQRSCLGLRRERLRKFESMGGGSAGRDGPAMRRHRAQRHLPRGGGQCL
mmetsp:Transcript_56901/g.166630  ORF Transcript_56901/g.166630 Transcript_56901/m.166630 type:complete len:214 (+) Transcript_56901:141-782(+)